MPFPTPTASSAVDLDPSLRLSRLLFPAAPAEKDHSWMAENERTITSLFRCVEQGHCGPNQTKVVILAAGPFRRLLSGENGGEAIWANSTVIALQRLGYSYLYSSSRDIIQLYQMFRQLVSVIMVDATDSEDCFNDPDCVLSEHKPHGIPAWKIFSFHFWDSPHNPLGRKWTLSPEDVKSEGNTYLGYSIESQCARPTFIPHQHRPHQAYVLAKEAKYFAHEDYAYGADFFDAASAAAGIRFVAGVRQSVLPEYFPNNITNVGFQSPGRFYELLAESRVLVGIGMPVTQVFGQGNHCPVADFNRVISSPTPYEALCLGVPFINPIRRWDADDPTDRMRWMAQHPTLQHLDPPYVYNVFQGDKAGFVKAVVAAASTPIESFVLENMRMRAVEARLASILETDWKAEAANLLAERQESGAGEVCRLIISHPQVDCDFRFFGCRIQCDFDLGT
ncbi:hypothetical protein C8R47DRAFT_988443 [Mycena vitilis]|nr:hypothetical protein C8R47DRAFT_988443 [Mycena vitilis]